MKKSTTAKVLISVSILCFGISALILISQRVKIDGISAVLSFNDQNKKIKILIVPGHEPNAGGADEYKAIKERDLNLQLSTLLKNDLVKNPNIEVIMARDENGWNPDLENYVKTNELAIMNWVADMKIKMLSKVDAGEMELIDPNMKHNPATSTAVLYLYGTNKWIEDNKIDLVLHVHFNSNPKINGKPNFRGYCMYIPEKQYSNSSSSKVFANYLNEEISKIEKPSNMLQEKDTIIEDQQLIATGNYDTLKIPSVVVEYAYIYEPMMLSSSTRNIFIEKAASSTATAINNYIEKN
ncbi:MAG: N-acetylmuramoyl-L-alanine amidase [bacterium]